jgi:arabinose-5-phosphate isomerase
LLDKARNIIKLEAEAIAALADKLDNNFSRAVELINQTSGRVIVTGIGKSGIVAKKIASTFSSIGISAFFFHPAEGIHGDLGVVRGDDLLIAISKSGNTEEIIKILPVFKRLMIPLIAITGDKKSALAEEAEVVLDVSVPSEACPINLVPTSSTTAAIVMGDALAMVLLDKRGFTTDDFANLHPGGSIGRNLIKVKQLMRADDSIPSVKPDTMFFQLVLEITGKRLGMTTVVDDENKLLGIVTDGDLRRAIEKKGQLEKLNAKDVMTANPKTISPNRLCIEALNRMERYKITSLVVADSNKRVVGVLHMHDLLQAKII